MGAGCVVEPGDRTRDCFKDKDCGGGEVCGDDRICYGNPPPGPLAVRIDAPGDLGLPPAELEAMPAWNDQGYFDLRWTEAGELPVEISGRVVLAANPDVSVGARVVLRRLSRIPGGPDYVVTAESVAGLGPDKASFSATVLPTRSGESYEVVIYPADSGPAPTPAELAPPYRQQGFSFIEPSAKLTFPLGGQNAQGAEKRIRGRVKSAGGQPIAGLVVRAFGKFGPLDRTEVASNLARTDAQGQFSLRVPVAWLDQFDVLISPPSGTHQPEVRLYDVTVDDPVGQTSVELTLADTVLPAFPPPADFEMPVIGTAPEGGQEVVVGATVRLTTTLVESPSQSVTFRALAQVGPDGRATFKLIPGLPGAPRSYLLDVIPLPDAPYAQVWSESLAVGSDGELALPAPLARRVVLTGQVLDEIGVPAGGVLVRLVPSPTFVFALADTPLDLTTARWPETITGADGRFSMWIDQNILDTQAAYTLHFEPTPDSLLPFMTVADVGALPDDTGTVDLAELWLPNPAYGRGTVRDPLGQPVAFATVFVYEPIDQSVACAKATGECRVPAPLRALAQTDEQGGFRLILPRP
jgi:hypothetical protein